MATQNKSKFICIWYYYNTC